MDAMTAWYAASLASQSPDLRDALGDWQGAPEVMRTELVKQLNGQDDGDHDSDVSMTRNTRLIREHLEHVAQSLPVGTVLWRAHDGPVIDMEVWRSASQTRAGAVTYGNNRYPHSGYTLHKLIVASDGVKGVAVNADASFAHEREVLIAPGVVVIPTGLIANDGTVTSNLTSSL